jgi:hypothetical protein
MPPHFGGMRDRIPTRDGTANFISPNRLGDPAGTSLTRSRHRHARQISKNNTVDQEMTEVQPKSLNTNNIN